MVGGGWKFKKLINHLPSPGCADAMSSGSHMPRARTTSHEDSIHLLHLQAYPTNLPAMFSVQRKGPEGLEKFEAEDMLSAIADIQKARKDIETKKKRKQAHTEEDRKHNDALSQLKELYDEWNSRTYYEPPTTAPVMTINSVELRNDPRARHAIGRLHQHLKLRQNPVAMDNETWLTKLKELSAAFVAFLPQSTVPNPDSVEIWQPKHLDPLPLEGMNVATVYIHDC